MAGGLTGRGKFLAGVSAGWVLATAGLLWLAQSRYGNVWPLTKSLARWDGGWYLKIAQSGYVGGAVKAQSNLVFFPLYPAMVGVAYRVTHVPAVLAGVAVSLLCFLLALWLFYELSARRYDVSTARWATIFLAFNPFALYFCLVYTESLFLLVSVLVFWLIERRWWWRAAAVAGLAAATRVTGALLGIMVLAQWVWQHREDWRGRQRWKRLLQLGGLGAICLSGLAVFAAYLQFHNHDALAFIHLQRYWGRPGTWHLLPQLLKFIAQSLGWQEHIDPLPYVFWYGSAALGVAGLAVLIRQREYWFALYVGLSLLVPLATGSIMSMNRYVMVLFPLYIALARLLRGRLLPVAAGLSGLLFFVVWWVYLGPWHPFMS